MADAPAPPVNDAQLREDFLATRARAASPDVEAAYEAIGAPAGAKPASPSPQASGGAAAAAGAAPGATPSSAASGPTEAPGAPSSLPIGLQAQAQAPAPPNWWVRSGIATPESSIGKRGLLGSLEDIPSDLIAGVKAMWADHADPEAQWARDYVAGKKSDPETVARARAYAMNMGLGLAGGAVAGPGGEAAGAAGEAALGAAGTDLTQAALDTVRAALKGRDVNTGAVGQVAGGAENAAGEAPAGAAKATAEGEAPAGSAAAESAEPPKPFTFAGSTGPVINPPPGTAERMADYLAGKTGDNPVMASLEGLSDVDARNEAIERLASYVQRNVTVKPDDVARMGAYSLGLTPEEIAAGGFQGKMLTDEQTIAQAMLLNSASVQMHAAALKAVSTGLPEDWEAATNAFALHNDIIGRWNETGTEQGRAMRARQQAQQATPEFSQQISDIVGTLKSNLQPADVEAAIRRVAALPDPEAAGPFLRSLRFMGSRDGFLYGWYNALLSYSTPVKKIMSDNLAAAWNVAVRFTAEKAGSGAVPSGETAQLLAGYGSGFGDAFRAAGRAMKAGESQFMPSYTTLDGLTKTRLSLLANGADAAQPATSTAAAAAEYLRMALPTTITGATDDFYKALNYRAELQSAAFREGTSKGLAGDALEQHIADQVNVPSQALHEQAKAATLNTTFSNPIEGKLAAGMKSLADASLPIAGTQYEFPIGRVVLPFANRPANFVRFAYRNGPLAYFFRTQALQDEMASSPAARDLAYARMGLGSAAAMATLGLAVGRRITGGGPADPQINAAWRNAGNDPYSVRVGDRWYQYNRVEPLGSLLGTVADTVNVMQFAHEADASDAAASLVFGFGNALLSKTYMQGLSDFLQALQKPDEDQRRYAQNLIGSLVVPQGASQIAHATDPWMRAHYGYLDTIWSRMPGKSEGLPPDRTWLGDPIPWREAFLPPLAGDSAAAKTLSPISMAPAGQAQPIDQWIWENRQAFPQEGQGRLGIVKPGRTLSYQGAPGVSAQVTLTPQARDRLIALAGNELKDPATGLGTKDSLNALAEGRHPNSDLQQEWNAGSPELKAEMVLRLYDQAKTGAKKQLLGEYKDLREAVDAQMAQRAASLKAGAGASGGGTASAAGGRGGAIQQPEIGP